MKPERDKIAARIRALLAKTVENGCTEDEAVAATAKAAEMLAKHNLTVDEVQLRENPFGRHTERHEDAVGERLWKVAKAIAELTGSRYWASPRGVWPVSISFFGFDHEVEVSKYLLAICRRAMSDKHERLQLAHRLKNKAKQRQIILPFLDGMADRLHQRILDLKPPAPTGTGLVVLRNALIDAALKDEGVDLKQQRMRASRNYETAYGHGVKAADRVSLNRGLESSTESARQLGRRS